MRRAGRTLMATLLCGSLAALIASPMALAQGRGNSGLPAGSGNPMATLESQITGLQQQIAALSTLASDVASLKTQMAALSTVQAQINALRTQASQQMEYMAAMGRDITMLKGQLADLGTLQSQITALRTQATEQANALASLGKDVSALREQLATLSALQRQVNVLSSQVQNMSGLQRQVDALNAQIASLSAQVANGGGGADKLAVYDTTDQKVGDVVGVQDNVPWVNINLDNRSIVLQVLPQQLVGQALWYGLSNCTPGPAGKEQVYISGMTLSKGANVFALAAVHPLENMVYAAEANTPPVLRPVASVMDASGCTSFRAFNQSVVPAVPVIDLNTTMHQPYTVR